MNNKISFIVFATFFIGMIACSPQTDSDTSQTTETVIDEARVDSIENTVESLEAEIDDILDGLE